MIVLGVDPDSQATGLALLKDNKPVIVGLASIEEAGKVRGKDAAGLMAAVIGYKLRTTFKGADHAVVEFPQHYGKKGRANPNNLMLLAAVSGAACAATGNFNVALVYPNEWKGSVPKHIHQRRVLERIGWDYTSDGGKKSPPVPVVPEDVRVVGDVPPGRWKEIIDAIGLALYATT